MSKNANPIIVSRLKNAWPNAGWRTVRNAHLLMLLHVHHATQGLFFLQLPTPVARSAQLRIPHLNLNHCQNAGAISISTLLQGAKNVVRSAKLALIPQISALNATLIF